MRREYLCLCYATVALLLFSAVATAQVGPLRGRVSFKLASGELLPIEGAVVDVFRTDLPAKYQTTTDKEGRFIFAGLPFAGSYILSISAPNTRPEAIPDVKAGREIEYEITLEPGDGKRLTLEEARARAEEHRIAGEPYETLGRSFKAGNEALNAKRFDEAIKQYDKGIMAVPDQLALQPALWANKSVALRSRGVEQYNASVTAKDEATKTAKVEAARRDFRDAVEAATKAVEILRIQIAPTDPNELRSYNNNKYFALAARVEALRHFVVLADASQADAALSAFQEYIEAESDPYKRTKARLDAARMLLDVDLADRAVEEFQRILLIEPDNLEALFGAGVALYRSGNKNRFSEATEYLQKFVDRASDAHPMKQRAKETLENLRASR
ncbi:MAG TPA: carboxypeptidase regulatory-like domain-containing protein [Pyrinomonadaceae bacterium]